MRRSQDRQACQKNIDRSEGGRSEVFDVSQRSVSGCHADGHVFLSFRQGGAKEFPKYRKLDREKGSVRSALTHPPEVVPALALPLYGTSS